MGCPATWCSKLQAAIAASAMEAEHAALPMPLRAAAPLLGAAKVTTSGSLASGPTPASRLAASKAAAHEGSQGALALAKPAAGRGAPRPKLCALKMRWLRSWLNPRRAEVKYAKPEHQKAQKQ